MPILIEDKRLGKAIEHRLAFDKSAVDITSGDFAARRQCGVIDAAPAADADMGALFVFDVAAKRRAEDRDGIVQVVQAYTDHRVGLVADGADVAILAIAFAPQQIDGDGSEFFDAVVEGGHQNLAAVKKTPVMVADAENVELFLCGIPVAAQPAKPGRAVVERVRHYTDFGFCNGADRAFEVGVLRHSFFSSSLGREHLGCL